MATQDTLRFNGQAKVSDARERYCGCVDVSIYRRSRESERPVVSTIALIFANRCGEAIINSTGTFFFFSSFGYECTFMNTVTLLSVNNHHNKFVSLQLFNRRASRAFHLKWWLDHSGWLIYIIITNTNTNIYTLDTQAQSVSQMGYSILHRDPLGFSLLEITLSPPTVFCPVLTGRLRLRRP